MAYLLPWHRDVTTSVYIISICVCLRVFFVASMSSGDVMTSILNRLLRVSHDVMAAIFVSQTSPVGVELFSCVNAFFCSNKFT